MFEKFQIGKKDYDVYNKALKIADFMKNSYTDEDIRFVSAYLFNDSKIIDKNIKLKKLFNSLATVERPNIIYIRTDTNIMINGINIKELTEKLRMCALFGGDINSIEQTPCSVVVSENLSFFMSAEPNNAIFLYSKGFHLINSLTTFIRRLKYGELIHFGDVDYEGLSIFEAFKKNLQDMIFYPGADIAEIIVSKYRNSLPKTKQDARRYSYSNNFLKFIEGGLSIEQEFVHTLFCKGVIKKPGWIK